MKRRVNFLMLIIFALCGIFAGIKLPTFVAHASSQTASVWDGKIYERSDLTNADYYEEGSKVYIRSAKGFSYFANSVNKSTEYRTYSGMTVYLETDIDLAGKAWTPIGSGSGNVFQGTFNGAAEGQSQGHYIYNLSISGGFTYAGLFGITGSAARILNTHLRNIQINANASYVGAIAGSFASTDTNAFSNNSVEGNIYANATAAVGGLVGTTTGAITSCFANVNINVNNTTCNVGGLVGTMAGSNLRTSFAEGKIEANAQNTGGLVGLASSTLSITDSYNATNVTATNGNFGGLVGNAGNSITLNHTYNIGDLPEETSAQTFKRGALIGMINSAATIQNSFYVYETSDIGICNSSTQEGNASSYSISNVYSIKKDSSNDRLAKTREFYLDTSRWAGTWDLTSLVPEWGISRNINSSYPYLIRTAAIVSANNDVSYMLSGSGTVDDPYIIETAGDLAAVAEFYNNGSGTNETYYFSLKNDISLLGRSWQPIGHSKAFNGVFDGNGHSITDLTCSLYEQYAYHGLFGQTENAVIKNLTMENVRFLSNGQSGHACGNFIGYVAGTTYLINCADYNSGKTIGAVATTGASQEKNLTVVYGKENVTISGSLIKDNLKLTGMAYNTAYEVTINGNGGIFYETYALENSTDISGGKVKRPYATDEGKPYYGEYKVIWEYARGAGQQHYFKLKDVGAIDASYGKSLLPVGTENWGEDDVLYLRGKKLESFRYTRRGGESVVQQGGNIVIESSSQDSAAATIIEGIDANWQTATQTVRVYYNQYEKDNFSAEINRNAEYLNRFAADGNKSDEIISIDDDGLIYVDYKLEYNSLISDGANEKIFETLKYGDSLSVREGFEVGELYYDTSFRNKVEKTSNGFVNGNFQKVYAKWVGQNITGSIDVKFNTNHNIDLQDAVQEIWFTSYYENGNDGTKDYTQFEPIESDFMSSIMATFDYEYTISDSMDDSGKFTISLKNGFQIEEGSEIVIENSPDANFGVLTSNIGTTFTELQDFNNALFYNLVGKVTVSMTITPTTYDVGQFSIAPNLVFGVSPMEEMSITKTGEIYRSNVSILSGAQYIDILSFADDQLKARLYEFQTSQSQVAEERRIPLYVGFDFKNKMLIFSNTDHDIVSCNFAESGTFYFTHGEQRTTYRWDTVQEKIGEEGGEDITETFYVIKKDSSIDNDFIVKYSTSYRGMLSFPARTNFVVVMDTTLQTADSMPIDFRYENIIGEEGDIADITVTNLIENPADPNRPFKGLWEFEKLLGVDEAANRKFQAFTTFEKAYLDIEFVTKAEDGTLKKLSNHAPSYTLYSVKTTQEGEETKEETKEFDISTSGKIQLDFTNTRYYEVVPEGILYNQENYTLKVEVESYNTEDAKDNDNFRAYFEGFENNNSVIFTNVTSEKNTLTLDYARERNEDGIFNFEGWLPGLYKLSIVCRDVQYTVNVRNVFVDVDGNVLDNVQDSGIQTKVSFLDTETVAGEDVATAEKTSLYTTDISISTELTENKGFVFKGWNFDGAEDFTDRTNIHSYATSLTFTLSQYNYSRFVEEQNEITISAVYTVKQVRILGYRSYSIQETDELGTHERFESGRLTYTLTQPEKEEIIYNYNTANIQQTLLNIWLSQNEYLYYYIIGYKIVNDRGTTLAIAKTDEGEDVYNALRDESDFDDPSFNSSRWDGFSLDDYLEYILRNDQTASTSKTLYLSPILKRKSITLIFHSGTGDLGNQYGDEKNGTIYANTTPYATEVPNDKTFEIVNPTSTIYLNTYNVEFSDRQIALDQVFYSRVGYTKPDSNYWAWKNINSSGTILYSQLSLIPQMYNFNGTSGEVHFYINWQVETYNITFRPGDGFFEDGDTFKTIQVEYDAMIRTEIPVNISRNGYSFAGWGIDGDENKKIFDEKGVLVGANIEYEGQTYFVNRYFKHAGNIVLLPIWSSQQFTIIVDYNSGTDIREQTSQTYTLLYGGSFAGIFNIDGTLIEYNVSREGYLLDGFYVANDADDTVFQRITATTIFSSSLLGFQFTSFTDPQTVALTIYAKWRFDRTYFTLSMTNNRHESLDYIEAEQKVYFADYFAQDNITAKNITVNSVYEGFNISISVEHTKLSLMLDEQTQEEFRDYFVVYNAGEYQVLFEVILTDQASKFNLGEVRRFSFSLYVNVNRARLLSDESLNNNIYAQNIVKIIEPFVDLQKAGIMQGQNLSTVVSRYKAYEGVDTFDQAEDMQVYEYIMMKYYLLLTTNLANDYRTYKAWTYSDYLDYKQENESTVSTRIENLKFFTYYDYFNPTQTVEIMEYLSGISLKAVNIENVNLTPTKVTLNSGVYTISPFTLYDVRVYVAESENVSNYNLNSDADGFYFVIGSGYVMPQVLTLKNKVENPSVYYSKYYSTREVLFELDYPTYEYEETTFYNYNGIYINAKLYSSDREVGQYSFKDKTNYLFFDEINVALMEDDRLYNSRDFKLVLDGADIFTILDVTGVASVEVTAKYLTTQEDYTTLNDVDEDILYISNITYNIGEDAVTLNPIDNPEAFTVGMHMSGDVQLYQIEENDSNRIFVYLNQFVTELVISTKQMRLTDYEYASLYKWSENQLYNVDGTMESSDTLTLTREQFDSAEEDELSQTIYYAIFTDLVYVEYNFNFPSSYSQTNGTSSTLKLGESTYDSLYWPYEAGVGQCSSMFLVLNGNEYKITENREMLFRGDDGIFIGLNNSNRFQKVVFSCKWTISTTMNYIQLLHDEKIAVGTYKTLSYGQVVYLYNLNEDMFTYSYVWQKDIDGDYQTVSETDFLELANGGSADESGSFRLQIVAKIREEFYPCLDENSPTEYTVNADFSLEFVKNIIDSVEFSQQPVTYDSKDHVEEVTVTVVYRSWGNEDYGQQISRELTISQTDFIPLQVLFAEKETTVLRNAGTYTINLLIDDSKFEYGEITKSFQFVIDRREVDLDNSFTATKEFAASDPALDMNFAVRDEDSLVENITLSLSRGTDPSEDIGESGLYFASVGEEFKDNYIFKSNGVVIYDGETKPEALENSVGTFTITQADTLRLNYTVTTDDPAIWTETYVKGGFNVVVSTSEDDFVLQIKQQDTVKHQFKLVLNDAINGIISSSKILQILKTHFDPTIRFIIGDKTFDVAEDCEIYNYSLSNGAQLSTYYRNVEISLDYKFQITQQIIDITGITYVKTFDNNNTATISLEGEEINPEEYNGLYIEVLYYSVHAGDSVMAGLTLSQAGESENKDNFTLSQTTAYWKVAKLTATMTLEIDTDKERYKTEVASHYNYGILNVSNIKLGDFVKIKDVQKEDGASVLNWLYEGFYSLTFNHDESSVSEQGFLYHGSYSLTPEYEFQDFEMTVNSLDFVVDVLEIEHNLSKNFVVITVLDKIAASYPETITLSTGEVLNLEYTVSGQTPDTSLPEGNYDFVFKADNGLVAKFLNDSVVVTINANNQALGVVKEAQAVYARIVDENVDTLNPDNLKVVYSRESYAFVLTDVTTLKLQKTGADFRTFNVRYFTRTNVDGVVSETAVDTSALGTVTITAGDMLAVGKYNLSISMKEGSYVNIIFAENYAFEITQIVIDVEKLNIQKEFNYSRDITISEFSEKISGEDVSILARFEDLEIGDTKHVDLYLNGTNRNNYTLSSTSIEDGQIKKANATISLNKLSYVYGQISNMGTYEFAFTVNSNGQVVPSAGYKLSVEIKNATFSSSANRYLDVGEYTVNVSGESANYEIQAATFEIEVTALEQTLLLENNGMITAIFGSLAARSDTVTYTMTSTLGEKFDVTLKREMGTQLGFYRILSNGFSSQDKNYILTKVEDTSIRGAFQITRQNQRVFVLFDDGTTTFEVLYNGFEYNRVNVILKTDGYYMTITHTSGLSQTLEKKLGFFYLEGGKYNKYEEEFTVEGLVATLEFMNYPLIKQKGEYNIQSVNATSSTHDVKMGKDGTLYAFTFVISKIELELKDEFSTQITKTFNFKDAVYDYEDASELFKGITTEDGLSAQVKFYTDNTYTTLAKFVGTNYRVVITVDGANAINYSIPEYLSMPDGKIPPQTVIGTIERADVTFYVSNLTFAYGEKFDLNSMIRYEVDFVFDEAALTEYKKQRSWDLELVYNYDGPLSTTGNLPANEYSLTLNFNATDFKVLKYVTDNSESETLQAKLAITRRKLQLIEKSTPFEDMFVKTYDETPDVVNAFTSGVANFDISGVLTDDDVQVLSAEFENEKVGNPKKVRFVLKGADKDNYVLDDYTFGAINPIEIDIVFNYEDPIYSSVDEIGSPQLSSIGYPFVSTNNLTSNSLDERTKTGRSFPSMLYNNLGFDFAYWTLDFNILDNPTKVEKLKELIAKAGLTLDIRSNEAEGLFKVQVSNNAKTVEFIGLLVKEQEQFPEFYFKSNSKIQIVFQPNWDPQIEKLDVVTTDENGNEMPVGVISVNGSVDADSYSQEFDYDASIDVKVKAVSHAFYFGFYIKVEGEWVNAQNVEGVMISYSTDYDMLLQMHIKENTQIQARFSIQKVAVDISLADFENAELTSPDFVDDDGDKIYTWNTDYFTLLNVQVSALPSITRTGYQHLGYTHRGTLLDGERMLSELVTDINQSTSITLVPLFERQKIEVTLNFNHDNVENVTIIVEYGLAYKTSADWEENKNPSRTGFKFKGWQKDGVTIDENNAVTEAHTLVAQWEVLKFTLKFVVENAEISNSSHEFEFDGTNIYQATDVEFEEEITFKVTANAGYMISSTWAEDFTVEFDDTSETIANVTFKMPDYESDVYEYTLPIIPVSNRITITGEHIGLIEAYNNSTSENIDVAGSSFYIETDNRFTITLTAEMGYEFEQDITLSVEGIQKTVNIVEKQLVIEIESVSSNVDITITTKRSLNDVTIAFDEISQIKNIIVEGTTYLTSGLQPFKVVTGEEFVFFVTFEYGYSFDRVESEQFTHSENLDDSGLYEEGVYRVVVSNINQSGTVTIYSTTAIFTISTEVITWDSNHDRVTVDGNIAYINGDTVPVSANYQDTVTFTYREASNYYFAGWSKDGIEIFSSLKELVYTVEKDETIYAIFSASHYIISLATLSVSEVSVETHMETLYTELRGLSAGRYTNLDGTDIQSVQLYFGTNAVVMFYVPQGFIYSGYGYYNTENQFVYIDQNPSNERIIEVNITTQTVGENVFRIYFVVSAYSVSIDVQTQIRINETRQDNNMIGIAQLVGANGESVKENGYIEGSRAHYEGAYIPTDFHSFTVISYTGDRIYIRVEIQRDGYVFDGLVCTDYSVIIAKTRNEDIIYEVSNFVGDVDKHISLYVVFKPIINMVELTFEHNSTTVEGGVFEVFPAGEEYAGMISTSGNSRPSVNVYAFTDSKFVVHAYIKLGYYVNDASNLVIIDENLIVESGATYTKFSDAQILQSGFTGMLSFAISGFMHTQSIKIVLNAQTYTVKLRDGNTEKEDGGTLLATIKNVEFGSLIDLTNDGDITIEDGRLSFVGGKLNVIVEQDKYNFEGYFTQPSGAGVRYFDSHGNILSTWQESGFSFNQKTKLYERSANAVFKENGEIEISLYLYMSYLKTKIRFAIIPDIQTNITAQDIVSGVNVYNSWYYSSQPLYMEVTFGTNIYFNAPEIAGYAFYRFVINQRPAGGDWFAPAYSYSERTPWSTNQLDNFVECEVQIVYFAQVDIRIIGGEANPIITQQDSNSQALNLLEKYYVDTSKSFTLNANPVEGYEFISWTNTSTGYTSGREIITQQIQKRVIFIMVLEGLPVNLDFTDYDTKFGQIVQVRITPKNGTTSAYSLGHYNNAGDFVKDVPTYTAHVGDYIEFVLSVERGFAVVWDSPENVQFSRFENQRYYFKLELIGHIATNETLKIIPRFEDEILAVYINEKFADDQIIENAFDLNDESLAGRITNTNGVTVKSIVADKNADITLLSVVNPKYRITNIKIQNYGLEYNDMDTIFRDGKITITRAYRAGKAEPIIGTISLVVEYSRLLWENDFLVDTNLSGAGTSRNPYQISNSSQLTLMMQLVNSGAVNESGLSYKNASYILTDDIDLYAKFWTPIGTRENMFGGQFNFNNHTVTNIQLYRTDFSPIYSSGLFGYITADARIILSETSLWYIYLIVGIVLGLIILLIILLLVNHKKKKQREQMAKR